MNCLELMYCNFFLGKEKIFLQKILTTVYFAKHTASRLYLVEYIKSSKIFNHDDLEFSLMALLISI